MSEKSPGHRPKGTKKQRGGKKKPSVDPTKTGRALRQQFTAPTVTEIVTTIDQVTRVAPMNGPGATGAEVAHPVFQQFHTQFNDRDVDSVFDAVRHSKVVEFVEGRIRNAKAKPGRRTVLSYRALIVGLLLTAIDGKGVLCSEVANTLYRRLTPTAMRLLDLTALPEATSPAMERRQQWLIERRVRGSLHRLLAVLDPSIHPKGKSMPWEELRKRDRDLTPEEVEERQVALSLVCNRILQTPYTLLPASVKQKYRGSACVDATPLKIHARGRGVDSETASTDPDAGYYVRTGDHGEDQKGVRKAFYAYDINLMVAVCDHLGKNQYLPALPLAMHLDRPGADPAGATRRMMANLVHTNHQPRYLAGDGLYAMADPTGFHIPARQAGWKLVLPVLDDSLGIQASDQGLYLVEGHWYCPSIPLPLIDATRDFRAGTIDLDTYNERIKARATYRAKYKGSNTSGTQRWGCPASGNNPGVMCALKPKSEAKPFIGGPVLGIRKVKDRITPDPNTQTQGVWPKPCRQDTVTLDPAADTSNIAARYEQDLYFGTAEHTDTYNALRQSQEGLHGFAKDDAYEALAAPGKRRIRGLAAQSFATALLLAAAGIRKVRVFLKNAKTDDNGDLYVTRKERTGDHATSHLPPGTHGTRGDPDHDESDTDTEEAA